MDKNFTMTRWKYWWRCVLPFVLSIVLGGVVMAHERQQVLDREITVKLTDVSFDTALAEIARAANLTFAYSPDLLNVQERITLEVINRPVRQILETILGPRKIVYQVHADEKTILLKKRHTSSQDLNAVEELVEPHMQPQRSLLTGTVTDRQQQPLVGVNILIKGTATGTTTDADGRFSIEVEPEDVLVISFIGFATQELRVGNLTMVAIELIEDVKSLTEVVVNAGYWNVNDRERTGNISRVSAEEIAQQPVSNPMAALIGRMPGVYITENSGVPGSGFNIQIRGRNSLRNDGNDPLYIIDGIPFTSTSPLTTSLGAVLPNPSPLSSINPADIESIEILKDADATAIYGSRGANGVVLITTKKSKAGKTTTEMNVTHGVGRVTNRVDMLSTEQYLEMRNEAFANDGLTPGVADYDVNGTWSQTRYTNWQDVLIGGTAKFTNAQLSISGGNNNTSFLIGSGYNRQTTVFPGDLFYQRGNLHANFNHVSDNGKLNVSLSNIMGLENNNLANNTYILDIYSLAPNAPKLHHDDGTLNWENGTWTNPLAALERKYKSNTTNLMHNLTIGYEVVEGLTLKANAGYNLLSTREFRITPIKSLNPASTTLTGTANRNQSSGNTWIVEPQASYEKQLGRGKLTALTGATLQSNTVESISISVSGVENDELLENIASAANVVTSNTSSQYRYIAAFARLNYNWNKKYILNLTARRDGSSRFGPGKQFGNFAAVGAAWIFSNEIFIQQRLPFLSFGKLRGSYGTTGSDQIGNYGYLDSYSATTRQYQGPGLVPARLANPDFAWENNRKIEGALELSFLDDRISLSTAYYRNRSGDQLVGLPLPAATGFGSIQYNLPAVVQNTGWEASLTSVNISKHNFVWRTAVNFSAPRTKLIEFPNLESSTYANSFRVGEPLNISLSYAYLGIDPTTGLYLFDDLDGSGSINTLDQIKIVRGGLNFHGGIQNNFSYKGFELTVFVQFIKQVATSYRSSFGVPGRMGNQPTEVMNRWQANGDVTDVQKFSTLSAANTAGSRWIASDVARDQDASFVRLKSVALSWQLPDGWSRTLHFQAARFFLQGQNLITFTGYKGLDPETRGLPPLRMLTAGLHLTF